MTNTFPRTAFFLSAFFLTLCAGLLVHGTIGQTTPPTPAKGKLRCNCRSLLIASNPSTVKPGQVVEFHINSSNAKLLNRTFEWTVSAGKIISGQGTSKITVQTSGDVPTIRPPSTPAPTMPSGFVLSSEPSSIILSGQFRPRSVRLTALVKLRDSIACKCPPASFTVFIQSRAPEVNQPANVVDLILDESKLIGPVGQGIEPPNGCRASDDMIIDVSSKAEDPENDVLTYKYTVSGGKIIGRGANVKWDLTDARAGTYHITAGVDDGCGICGATKKATVTVDECPTCGLVNCPTIELRGPNATDIVGEYLVTANISGGSQIDVKYDWTITNGEIVEGQSTPFIRVRASSTTSDTMVTLKLDLVGINKMGMCPDTDTITIPKRPE